MRYSELSQDILMAYALKNAIEHDGQAILKSVLSPLFNLGLEKKDVSKIVKVINPILDKVNQMNPEEQIKLYDNLSNLVSHRPERKGLQELEDVKKGAVITRFAPSPSGPLHIGHALTGMPSSLYVQRYGGKFIIRIEDTNPDNIYDQAYEMINEESNWLFGNVSEFIVQSDRIEIYYSYVNQLIKGGKAYVCDCRPEEFKEKIISSQECPCRKKSLSENLERWDKMLNPKGYDEGEAVLRFKSNLFDPNPALRDFPLARINLTPHPRVGKKFRVWPLMNLSVSIDDMESGVTHVIRAKEHQDNAKRQEMIFSFFKKDFPKTLFLGRYKFTDMELSSSKTKKLIDEGIFENWEDIRLPFIGALKRRGYLSESFKELSELRGISEVDKTLTQEDFFKILNDINRQLIKESRNFIEAELNSGDKAVEILMPNKEIKTIYLNQDDFEEGQMVHFKTLGYCRYDSKSQSFWFAHT